MKTVFVSFVIAVGFTAALCLIYVGMLLAVKEPGLWVLYGFIALWLVIYGMLHGDVDES